MKLLGFWAAGLLGCCAAGVTAQQDTLAHRLTSIVVSVERVPRPVITSIGAVTVLTREDLAQRPVRSLADVVQQAPGFAFVDFEGSGLDPQAIVRGFYGGGEADYVLLLVDGRPFNAMESGRINWDAVPPHAIERIEIVRGGASAAWGDVALGGVINVITRADSSFYRAIGRVGADGEWRASFNRRAALGPGRGTLLLDLSHADGFRDNAQRGTGTVLASIESAKGWDISYFGDWRNYAEPGPLTTDELRASRTQSASYHRFDGADEKSHRLALSGSFASVRTTLSAEYRDSERIRTLRLAPTFGDTKERDLTAKRLVGTAEWRQGGLMLGGDASYGRINSDYYKYTASRGALDGSASGNRAAAAAFARYGVQATSALELSVGSRLDWLRDEFETDDTRAVPEPRSHTVFSPRAGFNWRYTAGGHLFGNVTRSFKAPTPDQLYDRRKIPTPFPPFSITFANPELKPQYGTSFEAGIYHARAKFDLSAVAYQSDMRDEIDFDIETFGYRNIGESRHRGIEAGLNLRPVRSLSAFANYTLQAVTIQSGDNEGNSLKAIPRHFVVAGATAAASSFTASLTAHNARKIWLDDANTLALPDWTRWDAKVGYRWRDAELAADLRNLFGAEYSSTGYPDAGSPTVYYYPAAGRTLQIGLTWTR